MGVVKSVYELELNDASWNRFQEKFNKYTEQLAKTPNQWKSVGKEQAAMATQFERMTAALMSQSDMAREQAAANAKEEKHLTLAERLWTSVAHSTKSVASSVYNATTSLLRWSGILGAVTGLLGFGGIWGIDRMAMGVANDRRSSTGLGMSIGENSAFNLNFGRFIDTQKFLGNVTDMMTDPSKSGPLWRFGVNPNGSTEGVASSLLDRLRSLAVRTPTNQLGMLNSQYGLSLGTDEWMRLHNMSAQEYGQARAGNSSDIRRLGVSDRVAKGWTDFTQQLDRAKDQIVKTFVIGLIPLQQPLMHLSEGFVNLAQAFLKSDLVKDGITGLGHWLDDLAKEISSDKFAESVQSFFSDAGTLGTTLHAFAKELSDDLPNIAEALHLIAHPGETFDKARAALAPTSSDIAKYPGALSIAMKHTAENFGLPKGLLETIKTLESGGAADAISPKGALGMFQLKRATAMQYGVENPFDPVQSMTGAAKLLQHLEGKYHGDINKVLAAYNWGEGNLDTSLAGDFNYKGQRHQKGWMPQETRQYVMNAAPMLSAYGSGVRVEINNNTGGNATVTVSGLAH